MDPRPGSIFEQAALPPPSSIPVRPLRSLPPVDGAVVSIFGMALVRERRITIVEEEQTNLWSLSAIGALRPARCPQCGR